MMKIKTDREEKSEKTKEVKKMAQKISVLNQKGGVSKSTVVLCLGTGLADRGKKVLLVDLDAQGSLGISLGCDYPEKLPVTMAEIFQMMKQAPDSQDAVRGILSHSEYLHYVAANRKMAFVEQELSQTEGGEQFLKRFLSLVEAAYDYILLDCPPALGMVTVNALVASDQVLIPTQAEYLAVKGLEQLLQTVVRIRRRANPNLGILGILPSMVNPKTRDSRKVLQLLEDTYGSSIGILPCRIPYSVRAKELSSGTRSIYELDRNGKVAAAYEQLVDIVLKTVWTTADTAVDKGGGIA